MSTLAGFEKLIVLFDKFIYLKKILYYGIICILLFLFFGYI